MVLVINENKYQQKDHTEIVKACFIKVSMVSLSVLILHNLVKLTVGLVMKSTEHNISLLSPSVTVTPCNRVAEIKYQLDYEPVLNLLTLTSSSAVDILIKKFQAVTRLH